MEYSEAEEGVGVERRLKDKEEDTVWHSIKVKTWAAPINKNFVDGH